jgi:hypothetical protein
VFFDGSDVGIDKDIGSIWFDTVDNALCMSFTSTFDAPNGVTVNDEDVLCFYGTSYGSSTEGSFASELLIDFSTLGNTSELTAFDFVP